MRGEIPSVDKGRFINGDSNLLEAYDPNFYKGATKGQLFLLLLPQVLLKP